MNYEITAMTQDQAEEIAWNWRYPGIYAFYDMDADPDDLQEFLSPEERNDAYFAVTAKGELKGFYSFIPVTEKTVEIGLGMKPEWTGKGEGAGFLEAGITFAKARYEAEEIVLSVAAFNQRAITLYRRCGFRETGTRLQETNGSCYEFMEMSYDCTAAQNEQERKTAPCTSQRAASQNS